MNPPVVFVPYGSRVYGTHRPDSDWDYLAIFLTEGGATGAELSGGSLNVQTYRLVDFQQALADHQIQALEAYFLSGSPVPALCPFALDRTRLRHALAQKASHSFVKAQKKVAVERDYLAGWKSLFHALRILTFGIQLARDGCITDFAAANGYWDAIWAAQETDWERLKAAYQPVYNTLASTFRSLAPKG